MPAPVKLAPPPKPPTPKVDKKEKEAKERAEKDKQRAWIMQYVEEESSSDEDGAKVSASAWPVAVPGLQAGHHLNGMIVI